MIEKLKTEKEFVDNLLKEDKFGFGLSERDLPFISVYANLTYILAKIYMRSDWKRIAHNPRIRPEDVFQHKIKSAGNRVSIRLILDRLCNSLGLQSIEILSSVIDSVIKNEQKSIQILRKESIYLSRKAIELSDILWKFKKGDKNENKQL